MKSKLKRHIVIPLLLFIYVIIMVVMAYPKYQESGNWSEFIIVLAICLILIVALFFIYKKKERIRDNFKNKS